MVTMHCFHYTMKEKREKKKPISFHKIILHTHLIAITNLSVSRQRHEETSALRHITSMNIFEETKRGSHDQMYHVVMCNFIFTCNLTFRENIYIANTQIIILIISLLIVFV